MRIFKLIGALVVVLAFSAIAVATASAAETLWKWLPGSVKETFTGKSGKATLQVEKGGAIVCQKSVTLLTDAELKISSELMEKGSIEKKDATLWLAVIHFEGCTTGGLEVHSLGDNPGIILVHIELHNCMIKKAHFGVLITPLLTHLEVTAVKILIEVLGSFVGLIEALPTEKTHFELNINQKEGKQEFKLCEGGVEDTLLSSENHKAFVPAAEEVKEGLLLFDGTIDKAGEEMMEK
jgi:hypothetical protein